MAIVPELYDHFVWLSLNVISLNGFGSINFWLFRKDEVHTTIQNYSTKMKIITIQFSIQFILCSRSGTT